jgi:hypothetical protein
MHGELAFRVVGAGVHCWWQQGGIKRCGGVSVSVPEG